MQTGTPSPTEATYRISLLDNHQMEHSDPIKVTFSTNLAQQESAIEVTLTPPITPDGACPDPGTTATNLGTPEPTPPPKQPEATKVLSDDYTFVAVVVITLLAVVIATFVICAAVKQGSSQPKSGFAAHYTPKSPQAAFTPGTQHTPHQQTPNQFHQTPPVPRGSGGSAFKRPGYSPSPQHGLFSQ